ncbi:PREDICTED: cytochrome P450 9e2-like [Polistes dominula]|uniref:Cytochrome P450 9e2-like n=1 Tax=Polistes dominula TaxID=743375 RepID=A0ABM1IAG3_POLDO|nr:PREDICTED: cytochrome P450 9e2-like [Polistes dominula]
MEWSWAWIISFVIVIISIYLYTYNDYNYFKKLGIPYIKSWPILGSLAPVFLILKPMAELLVNMYNQYPDAKYIGIFESSNPVLLIRDPELIKTIAVKSFDNFPEHRSFVDEVQDPLFGRNLFSLRGDRWKEARMMLSPTFTLSKLKGMFKLMNECGADFTDYLYKMPENKKMIELKDVFTRYTNDVIATCAFGISINSMKHPENEFYLIGREATHFGPLRTIEFMFARAFPLLSRLLNIKFVSDKVANYFENIVKDVIDTRDRNNIVRSDMIQLMIEARDKRAEMGQELPLIDIVAQAFGFFFGGFDSVSSAMCFTCHEICINSDIQKKLQKDIDEIIEKTHGNPTYDDINNMHYLGAVINESLRRYPIALMHDRLCIQDYELPPTLPNCKPLIVKKGMNVMFPVYAIHHDPKYFEDPYKFNPERFMENGKDIANSGTYFPFGIGPRMCIANRFAIMEIKVLIFHLLARCNLKPCSKTVHPIQLTKSGLNMNSANGFWVYLEERKDIHPAVKNLLPNSNIDNNNYNNSNATIKASTNGIAVKMDTWTIILTLVIVILSIYYYVKYIYNYFERINLPYLKPLPFLGNIGPAILRQKTLAEIAIDAYNVKPKEAKYIGFFDMRKPVIMIRDPELIKTVTVKSFDHFSNHFGFANEGLDILFTKNLFSLRDDKWKETRTMLSPTFTLSKLKGMFKLMNECAIDFTDYLSKMPTSKKTLEMKDVFTRYTNDVIATCAFGISINSMKDPNNDFYINGRKATNFDGFKSIIEKTNGNPTYDSINNMQYLDAVINESLRRYPIAVFLDRMVVDDYELPPALPDGKPYLLKKDKYIWITVYGLHHDPNYFENPFKFDPERFLIKGKEIINSGYYLPFGMGPRMCIGNRFALLEMKVLIFHLLARCNLKPCTKTQIPLKLSKKGLFGMTSEKGFWMTLEERDNVHPSLQNYVFDNDTSSDVKHNNINNVSTNNVSNDHHA